MTESAQKAFQAYVMAKMQERSFTYADAVKHAPNMVKYQPGTNFQYTIMDSFLPLIIKKASGMSADDFLREKIFKPMGMKDTGYFMNYKQRKRYLEDLGYNKNTSSFIQLPPYMINLHMKNKPYFNEGLVTTVSDYSKFMYMLLNDGKYEGKQIISPEGVKLMTTRTNKEFAGTLKYFNSDYGLGLHLVRMASSGLKDSYMLWDFGNISWADPKSGVVLTVITGCRGCVVGGGFPVENYEILVNRIVKMLEIAS